MWGVTLGLFCRMGPREAVSGAHENKTRNKLACKQPRSGVLRVPNSAAWKAVEPSGPSRAAEWGMETQAAHLRELGRTSCTRWEVSANGVIHESQWTISFVSDLLLKYRFIVNLTNHYFVKLLKLICLQHERMGLQVAVVVLATSCAGGQAAHCAEPSGLDQGPWSGENIPL